MPEVQKKKMSNTSVKKPRGRPKKSPEERVTPAEAKAKWMSNPENRKKQAEWTKAGREKRKARMVAIENFIKENNIEIPDIN